MIKNLTLKRQFQLGMLFALFIAIAVAWLTSSHSSKLTQLTIDSYKHPFTVTNAIRDANIHLVTMHRYMKSTVLSETSEEALSAIQNVRHNRIEFIKNTDIIARRYLGDLSDLYAVIDAEKKWSITRNNVINLVQNGKKVKAANLTKNQGTRDVQLIEKKMLVLLTFENDKAIALVDESIATTNDLNIETQSFLFLIFVVGGYGVWFLYLGLTNQITALKKSTSRLIDGDFETVVADEFYDNEIGTLSRYLEQLRLTLKTATDNVKANHEKTIQSKNLLQEERDFSHLILETAQALIVVLNTDGKVVTLNHYSEMITGFSTDEVKGKNWFEIFLPQEDQTVIKDVFNKTLHDTDISNHVNPIKTKAGDEIIVEWHNKVLRDSEGKAGGLISVGIDITARIETETLLNRAQNDLTITLESANLGLWDWRPQTEELFTNDIFLTMLGYSPDAFPQTLERWSSLVHPDDLKPTMDILEPFLQGDDGLYRSQHRMLANDGHEKWILDVGRVTERDNEGAAIRFMGIHIDITDQKKTEHSLVKAQLKALAASKAKSTFLANMSHELRTPMHGILSFANMGLKKPERLTQEKSLEFLGYIKSSADRLMSLINDLLDLSKLESGKMSMVAMPSSLMSVVQSCLAEQQARLTELNKSVLLSDNCIEGKGSFDPVRIGQVMTNFISNAIKFTPEDIPIVITIKETTIRKDDADIKALQFSIRDYGDGIPEGEFDLIFDRFEQSSATKSNAGGTGLGLPICKEIISAHSGIIWAENHPERGAIFSFIIPM